jgi:putative addiction module component (TIGR02574 family)
MNRTEHDVVEIDAEKLGETPVFRGTRVPIQNLFDCLETGESIETFLRQFPTVEREQVDALLEDFNAPEAEINELWSAEVESRIDEVESGEVKTIPLEEVFARMRKRYNKSNVGDVRR